VSKVIIVIF